jgi:uncharacterized protein
MAVRTNTFDLSGLHLRPGEARRLELSAVLSALELGGDAYVVTPAEVPVTLDVTRMNGGGWSLRLRFSAEVHGPCMRCLRPAAPVFIMDAREIEQPGGGAELDSPYVTDELVDLDAWARDALVLALPTQIICAADCPGLCPECGERLAELPADHAHERPRDARWDVLGELKFD